MNYYTKYEMRILYILMFYLFNVVNCNYLN